MTGTLKGIGVLITRPAHQADTLMSLVEAAGGHSFLFPTIEIQPLENATLDRVLSQLADYDVAIFISANAVTFGFEAIAAHHARLPDNLQLAAVGAATAGAMEARGHTADIVPKGDFRSESLLALDTLEHVASKRIVIFRGQNGRELLANTLRRRGATVDYAECYRRAIPQSDPSYIEQHWSAGKIDVVTATSIEGVKNLHKLLNEDGKALMKGTPIIVISTRMAQACEQMDLTGEIVLADDASDPAIVAAIEAWHRRQKSL